MKIIDSTSQDPKSQTPSMLSGMIDSIRLGRTSLDIQSQEAVINALEKVLDHRYIMLRNVALEDIEEPIPLVLVGPHGVTAIFPNASRGVYRAKGDDWEQMDDTREIYRPALTNLIVETQQMAYAVENHLKSKMDRAPSVEPTLVFTDPGIHIEMVRPSVRIVMLDAIDRFNASLLRQQFNLDRDEVETIVDILARSIGVLLDESPFPERDAFSFADETESQSKIPDLVDRIPRGEGAVRTLNKIPFSNRQWLVLGLLVVVNIIILTALVLFILFSS